MVVFYWHIHHEQLIEPLREPIESRIAWIKEDKPKSEQPIRLRLMRPVMNPKALPALVVQAAEECLSAISEYNRLIDERNALPYQPESVAVREALDRLAALVRHANARDANAELRLYEAMKDCKPELEALHAKECFPDCPWDGRTIFPGKH